MVTLAGLAVAVCSIYSSIRGAFEIAAIVLLWAELADWWDGKIARALSQRTPEGAKMGRDLDSLADIVAGGIATGVLLLCIGHHSPWFLPGAVALALSCAVRLAYFNVFGMVDDKTFLGLPAPANITVVCTAFLVATHVDELIAQYSTYAAAVICAVLNVSAIRVPKWSSTRSAITFTGYVVIATVCVVYTKFIP